MVIDVIIGKIHESVQEYESIYKASPILILLNWGLQHTNLQDYRGIPIIYTKKNIEVEVY
jgi:hypothetical protein